MLMWTFTCGLICLSAFTKFTQQASLPEDPYYTAGVVEFYPTTLQENLPAYLTIINSTDAQDTDIIVFPESTLNDERQTTFVPDPATFSESLCTAPADVRERYHNFLVQLSCQARAVSKYIVINLTEKEQCSANAAFDPRPCSENDINIYNTNVVFDREGRVISRYRKVNLYGEPKNATYVPEYGIFETDFGVRFGHFVCFDLLFYVPAQEMVEVYGIRDFLFPTMWFSQLPFLTAVQAQFAWAYANDVNFLAAGASYPKIGSTGSGIYNGRHGALVQVMNQGAGERKLYVARVPKLTTPSRNRRNKRQLQRSGTSRLTTHEIFLKRDYLEQYQSVLITLDSNGAKVQTLVQRICDGTFCCRFSLRWRALSGVSASSRYYTYRLGAFAGKRKEEDAETNALRNCAIFACTGDDVMDCGKTFVDATDENGADLRVEPQIAFESIEIAGDFPDAPHMLLQPNSLRDDLLPLQVGEFKWEVSQRMADERLTHHVRYTLNTTTKNLLAFSIYGNYFDGDDAICCADAEDDGASALLLPTVLLWTLTLLGRWAA